MAHRLPRILVAAIPEAARVIALAMYDLQVTSVHVFDEAVRQFRKEPPDLVLVSYHFDELRPFRLIQQIREEGQRIDTPIILVRVLPLLLGQEKLEEIRAAYKAFGADDFVSLYDDQQQFGVDVALQRFRDTVSALLLREANHGADPMPKVH